LFYSPIQTLPSPFQNKNEKKIISALKKEKIQAPKWENNMVPAHQNTQTSAQQRPTCGSAVDKQ
jgi:hypothetical protein